MGVTKKTVAKKLHPLLTPAMAHVLRIMLGYLPEEMMEPPEPGQENIGEDLCCDGWECWVGMHRTNWQMVYALLNLCLISGLDETGGSQVYSVREWEARKILEDPTYEPMIVKAIRTGKPVHR